MRGARAAERFRRNDGIKISNFKNQNSKKFQ
jgi:hypothetical protein